MQKYAVEEKRISPLDCSSQLMFQLKIRKRKAIFHWFSLILSNIALFVISIIISMCGILNIMLPTIKIETGIFQFATTPSFILAISICITILLLFGNASKDLDAITAIENYFLYVKDPDLKNSDMLKKGQIAAENTLSPVDKAFSNQLHNFANRLKSNKEENNSFYSNSPHENREVFRTWILFGGVASLMVLSALRILSGDSLPIVLIWVGFAGLILFFTDILSYNLILQHMKISICSAEHQKAINLKPGKHKHEDMAFIRQIFFMARDRIFNHDRLFTVLGYVANYLGLLFTALALGDVGTMPNDLLRWIRIPFSISNMNGILGFILICISGALFIRSCCHARSEKQKIANLNNLISLKYSPKNYAIYDREFNLIKKDIMRHKFGAHGFHMRFNISQATFEYNIEILYHNSITPNAKRQIPMEYICYKDHLYLGNRQRLHFIEGMAFFLSFCYLVWDKQSLDNVFIWLWISIVLVFVAIISVTCFLRIRHSQWNQFEKAIVKSNSLSYKLIQRNVPEDVL